jgi:hypothetical protein
MWSFRNLALKGCPYTNGTDGVAEAAPHQIWPTQTFQLFT